LILQTTQDILLAYMLFTFTVFYVLDIPTMTQKLDFITTIYTYILLYTSESNLIYIEKLLYFIFGEFVS